MSVALEIIRRTIQSDLDRFKKAIQEKELEHKKHHVHDTIDDVMKRNLEMQGYPVDDVISQDEAKFQLDYDALEKTEVPKTESGEQPKSGAEVYEKFLDSMK
jgi:hypothetical protein